MAAGLPVVAFNRGSIPELIKPGYNGEIVHIKKKSDPFQDSYPFEIDQYHVFFEFIRKVSKNINDYSKNVLTDVRNRFILSKMIRAYYEIF